MNRPLHYMQATTLHAIQVGLRMQDTTRIWTRYGFTNILCCITCFLAGIYRRFLWTEIRKFSTYKLNCFYLQKILIELKSYLQLTILLVLIDWRRHPSDVLDSKNTKSWTLCYVKEIFGSYIIVNLFSNNWFENSVFNWLNLKVLTILFIDFPPFSVNKLTISHPSSSRSVKLNRGPSLLLNRDSKKKSDNLLSPLKIRIVWRMRCRWEY